MKQKILILSAFVVIMSQITSCKKDNSTQSTNNTSNSSIEVISSNITLNRKLTKRKDGLLPDYYVSGMIEINNGAILTVDSGVVIKFKSGAGFLITGGGGLNAIGTATAPIKFTGDQQTAGYWGGLYFVDADNTSNRLEFCTIEYGGKDSYLYDEGNIVVGSNSYGMARLAMRNCTVRYSLQNGIYVSSNSFLTDFTNNTVTLNTMEPLIIDPHAYFTLGTSNSFTGNTNDYIKIPNQLTGTETTHSLTFEKVNVPFLVAGNLYIGNTFTLNPGCRVLMGQNTEIQINGQFGKQGVIKAIGTSVDSIIITGLQKTNGFWNRIGIESADNNDFRFCRIEYGGKPGNLFNDDGLVVVSDEVTATVNLVNCKIQHSLRYGLYLLSATTYNSSVSTINSFLDNSAGNVYIKP